MEERNPKQKVDAAAWSEEKAAAIELGVAGQGRLGEWGHPVAMSGEAFLRVGRLVLWRVDDWGAASAERLHFGDATTLLRESDWQAFNGSTLCRRKLPGLGTAKTKWGAVPTIVPAGFTPAREVPPLEVCAECARALLLTVAGDKALLEMLTATDGNRAVAMRPVVWRSRALWGVAGEAPYVGPELPDDAAESGDDTGDDDGQVEAVDMGPR